MAVLADGMGGLMGGQMASNVAIDSFKAHFTQQRKEFLRISKINSVSLFRLCI